MNWLARLTNPNREAQEKSRVVLTDMRGYGLSVVEKIPKDGQEWPLAPEYKGTITPDIAARIFVADPGVRACCDAISSYGSVAPLRLYRRKGKETTWRKEENVFPAPMLDFVNPVLTQVEYVAKLLYFLSLFENAYVAIEPNSGPTKEITPFCLWPMNPMFTKLIADPETGAKYYRYKTNGAEAIYFEAQNVIHIAGFSPFDNFYGLPKLNALDYDIRKSRFAKKYLARYYSAAATLSGVLTTDKEGEDEIEKLKRQLETGYRGGDNAFRVLVLEKGMEYTPMAATQIEVNSVPVMKDSLENTMMVMGVPSDLFAGDVRKIEGVEELFWNRTLLPMLKRISQMHTKKLCAPLSRKLKIEFDTTGIMALRRQWLERARVHVAYQNNGVLSPNEVRQDLGEDPWTGEFEDFGNAPTPVWDVQNAIAPAGTRPANAPETGTSPSLTLPGSRGSQRERDQSARGEAQMLDEHLTRGFSADEFKRYLNYDFKSIREDRNLAFVFSDRKEDDDD